MPVVRKASLIPQYEHAPTALQNHVFLQQLFLLAQARMFWVGSLHLKLQLSVADVS